MEKTPEGDGGKKDGSHRADTDIGYWLSTHGFGTYGERFASNHIDSRLLGELTHEDLQELGMESRDERLRFFSILESAPPGSARGTE